MKNKSLLSNFLETDEILNSITGCDGSLKSKNFTSELFCTTLKEMSKAKEADKFANYWLKICWLVLMSHISSRLLV